MKILVGKVTIEINSGATEVSIGTVLYVLIRPESTKRIIKRYESVNDETEVGVTVRFCRSNQFWSSKAPRP